MIGLLELAKILWIFLPAGVANMAPVLFKSVDLLNYPVDLNKTFMGVRILGDHKTWRGLFFGITAGALCASLQDIFWPNIFPFSSAWQWGALLGLGALSGDMIKSFFKRRLSVNEGESLWVADQVDWILGALLVTEPIAGWTLLEAIYLLWIGAVLHMLSNVLGYYLNIKSNLF